MNIRYLHYIEPEAIISFRQLYNGSEVLIKKYELYTAFTNRYTSLSEIVTPQQANNYWRTMKPPGRNRSVVADKGYVARLLNLFMKHKRSWFTEPNIFNEIEFYNLFSRYMDNPQP